MSCYATLHLVPYPRAGQADLICLRPQQRDRVTCYSRESANTPTLHLPRRTAGQEQEMRKSNGQRRPASAHGGIVCDPAPNGSGPRGSALYERHLGRRSHPLSPSLVGQLNWIVPEIGSSAMPTVLRASPSGTGVAGESDDSADALAGTRIVD